MTIRINSLNGTSICLCTAWYASFSFWARPEYLPLSEQQYRSGQPFLSCPGHRGQVRGAPGPPESFRLRRRGGRLGQSCAGHGCAFTKGTYMSIKSKLLAGAAALALVGGVGTVGAMTAAAATPSCGQNCIDIFSRAFGTHRTPQFVMDVLRQGAKVGQPIILFRTSNTDPAEDFVPSIQGTTADFYAAGLVSAAVALHYGCIPGGNFPHCGLTGVDDPAIELEYAPFGVDSALCVGVAATATQGEGV